jgi:hypothetical protein
MMLNTTLYTCQNVNVGMQHCITEGYSQGTVEEENGVPILHVEG